MSSLNKSKRHPVKTNTVLTVKVTVKVTATVKMALVTLARQLYKSTRIVLALQWREWNGWMTMTIAAAAAAVVAAVAAAAVAAAVAVAVAAVAVAVAVIAQTARV